MTGEAVPQPSPRKRHARELFSGLPRQYDRMGALLSFGQDPRWRRAMVASVEAKAGDRVLDVATGTGMVAEALVRRYACTVVALDQSPEMLQAARERVAGDPRLAGAITPVLGEAEHLPYADAEFDHLTFTYLLRYVDDPAETLRELARVVRPGGRVASLEFGVPSAAPLRALWGIYTRVGLPAIGRLVSRQWQQTGSFLARSIPDLYARYSLDDLAALWNQAGIRDVQVRPMSFGAGVVTWGTRGGDVQATA